ncbi:MAG: transporter substrate-binding domain-containing protein [Pseudomonadales bacterium]|nr:transporter substrate-binding domain-containing protein [Pseudomonadales bacterium]
MTVASDVLQELAPKGVVRAAINFGNPVLAQRNPDDGSPQGVSADLAHELANRLGMKIEFVTFEGAGKVFAVTREDVWDLAFLAVDPIRSEEIAFTSPYVVIEGTYIVRDESPLREQSQFDQSEVRIAVGKGAAYDLFLTRHLEHAQLERADTSVAALELFVEADLEAAAGVRQPLADFAATHPGYRVIDGRFTSINQAMATVGGRRAGQQYLEDFVEEMKASGFVQAALEKSGQTGASVAPPADK